jgi:glycerol uptake facilitator-like aquaporin
VLIYMTAKVSGGKLNPAVSLGLYVSGALTLRKCLLECFAQCLGAVFGAVLSLLLTINTHYAKPIGYNLASGSLLTAAEPVSTPGCFTASNGANGGQVFLWEFVTTFVLVSVVFATAVDDAAAGHFVSIAPLAIGLSLFACAQSSGPFTGGCLNPARFFGPAIVYGCGWPYMVSYVAGELLGGALAGLLFKLRLRLQILYAETIEELAEQSRAEAIEGEPTAAGDAEAETAPMNA